MHTFYNGLSDLARTIIDASVRGALIKKITDQATRSWRIHLLTLISGLEIDQHLGSPQ